MYSQNNEEQIIQDYFAALGITKGNFLDIGAYNGVDLSNTRKLMEQGWGGVCIEPQPDIYESLCENCELFLNVTCIEAAIGNHNGIVTLHSNNTFYSTLVESETERWKGSEEFTKISCEISTFQALIDKLEHWEQKPQQFDFISIDCEGMDYDVLIQMDLTELGCKLLCVETNGVETQKYVEYCQKFGMHEIARNAENLIMGL